MPLNIRSINFIFFLYISDLHTGNISLEIKIVLFRKSVTSESSDNFQENIIASFLMI